MRLIRLINLAVDRLTRLKAFIQSRELKGKKCHYCGVELRPYHSTVDHLVALGNGGSQGKENCVPCCKACNHSKGSFHIETFRKRVFHGGAFHFESGKREQPDYSKGYRASFIIHKMKK